VFLEIVPSLDKFASLLSAGTVNDVKKIGQQAGKEFGDALTAGSKSNIEALKSNLSSAALATERASTQVADAHSKAAAAADKVQLAETKLAEARQKYASDSSQVMAAEQRLSQAKRDAELQAGKTALAESTLTDAQDKQALSAQRLKDAQEANTVTSAGLTKGIGVLAAGTVAAGVALGGIAVKSAADFQTQLTRLATSAGESTSNLKMVGDGILQMAGDVGTSTSELTSGMYTVESAGYHGADGLTVLQAAAQGAREENAQLSTVANAVTDILTDYHLPAQQAADVTSKLVTAVSLGKTNFEDLSGAMSSIAPVASASHVSLTDILGDLAEMTAHGVSADQAAQNLANTVRSLSNPTNVMTQELAQLGIRSDQVSQNLGKTGVSGALMSISDAIMQHMGPSGTVLMSTFNQSKIAAEDAQKMFQGLPPNLQKIATQFDQGKISMNDWRQGLKNLPADQAALLTQWVNMRNNADGFSQALKSGSTAAQTYTQALAKATGNSTSMNVALMLTGENAGSTLSNINEISGATNEAGRNVKGWSDIQGTFNQKLAEAKASSEAFITAIGEKLLPAATAALGWVTDFTHGLTGLGTWLKQNINWIGLFAAVIGGLVTPILAVKAAMSVWAAATKAVEIAQVALNLVMRANPIMLIATAIMAVVAGLVYAYFHFESFRNIVNAIGTAIKVGFLAAVHGIEVGFNAVVAAAKAVGAAAVWLYQNALKPAFDAIVSAVKAVGAAGVWLYQNALKPAFDAVVTAVKAVGAAAAWLWQNVLQPVFNFIAQAAIIVAKVIIAIWIAPFVLAIKGLAIIFSWLWTNAIKPALGAIGSAAIWVFQNILQPAFNGATAVVSTLGKFFLWLYDSAVRPVLEWIGRRFQEMRLAFEIEWKFLRDNVLQPLADFFVHTVWENGILAAANWISDKWTWLRQVFDQEWKFLRDNVLQPLADFFVHTVWENGILAAVNWISDKWKWLRQVFDEECKILRDDVLQPIVDFFVQTVWENGIKAALDALVSGFHDGVSKIGDIWDGLKKLFGTPVEFVIRTVLNDGIIKGINWVLKQVGISGIPNIPDPNLPTFATGGVVPGYAPGQDTVHALLSPGEGVLVPQATAALGGARGIAAINSLYGSGGTGPTMTGGLPGYGLGGFVSDVLNGIGAEASAAWSGLKNVVLGGLRAAAQGFFTGVVNPLVGQIPGSPDNVAKRALTGMTQKVETDLLNFLGQKDATAPALGGTIPAGQHLAIIDAALSADGIPKDAWAVWEAGLNTLISRESGWNASAVNNWDSNAKAGTPSTGLAQVIGPTFAAYRNKSLPNSLVDPVANVAAAINYIGARYGTITNVAQANANLPPQGYDSGGYLMPGVHTVFNATGRPEAVLTPQQTANLHSIANNPSGEVHVHVYPREAQSEMSIAHEVAARIGHELRR
jgi:TP901 family phage tail tape measure protein